MGIGCEGVKIYVGGQLGECQKWMRCILGSGWGLVENVGFFLSSCRINGASLSADLDFI